MLSLRSTKSGEPESELSTSNRLGRGCGGNDEARIVVNVHDLCRFALTIPPQRQYLGNFRKGKSLRQFLQGNLLIRKCEQIGSDNSRSSEGKSYRACGFIPLWGKMGTCYDRPRRTSIETIRPKSANNPHAERRWRVCGDRPKGGFCFGNRRHPPSAKFRRSCSGVRR